MLRHRDVHGDHEVTAIILCTFKVFGGFLQILGYFKVFHPFLGILGSLCGLDVKWCHAIYR